MVDDRAEGFLGIGPSGDGEADVVNGTQRGVARLQLLMPVDQVLREPVDDPERIPRRYDRDGRHVPSHMGTATSGEVATTCGRTHLGPCDGCEGHRDSCQRGEHEQHCGEFLHAVSVPRQMIMPVLSLGLSLTPTKSFSRQA